MKKNGFHKSMHQPNGGSWKQGSFSFKNNNFKKANNRFGNQNGSYIYNKFKNNNNNNNHQKRHFKRN